MPHLLVISAAGSSQRRLLKEALNKVRSQGYDVTARREGGLWSDYFEESMTSGLFASKTAIIVEEAQKMGKLEDKALSNLENKDSDSLLLLLYPGDHKKYLSKEALQVSTLIEAEKVPHWPDQRVRWLMSLARDKKINLDQDGASLLVEWVEDPEEIRSELIKLASIEDGKVDRDMVSKMVLNEGGRGMLKLLDGFCSRRVSLCIEAMRDLRDGAEVIPVLSALHKRVRSAWYVSIWGERAQSLGLTPYQMKQAKEASRLYDRDRLKELLAGSIKLSAAERTGASEGWSGLERFILGGLS